MVQQAIDGGVEAFDEIVRRHRGQIYTLIRTLAGGEADAEALTQESFVRAYGAIGRFPLGAAAASGATLAEGEPADRRRGGGHASASPSLAGSASTFRTWLTRIAVDVVRTNLAEHAGQRPAGQPTRLEVASDGEQWEARPAKVRIDATLSRRQAIMHALAMLPDECRIVLTLKDVQGFEYHEIAEVLDVPIEAVEARVFRARRRLRPLLQPWLQRSSSSSSSTHGGGAAASDKPQASKEEEDAEGLASSC